jgi:predicted RNase H-like HicB family nuclease
MLKLRVETEQENDGRWIAEVIDIPGALAYGNSRIDAIAKAEALAFRVLANRLEIGELKPEELPFFAV